ncbi:MAG: hypothetical protein J1F61_00765 [Clostridiales bacterium]|nr:hypothetical protein [Clostridiales bacterium]
MIELNEIIAQLKACATAISEAGNATPFKGPLIDAESHVNNAIEHVERHARNEQARAN